MSLQDFDSRMSPPSMPPRRLKALSGPLLTILGQIGTLEVRLARNEEEIRAAQRLRHQVFHEGRQDSRAHSLNSFGLDIDEFDNYCDHIIVVDQKYRNKIKVVGTYRLIRDINTSKNVIFYSAREFDINSFLICNRRSNILEMGRSCVSPDYRATRALELLWRGIWSYVRHYGIDLMFGCASFEGLDPQPIAHELSFLHHFAQAPPEWGINALPANKVLMARMNSASIDRRLAMARLPPLIKAYVRLGGVFGPEASVDRQFGTIDVLVAVRVADIDRRYIAHYGRGAARADMPSR